jgi:hypothetical protein
MDAKVGACRLSRILKTPDLNREQPMTWQAILMLAALAGALLAIVALIRPLPRLWLGTRWRAGFVLAANLVMGAIAIAFPPHDHCGCKPPIHREAPYPRPPSQPPAHD